MSIKVQQYDKKGKITASFSVLHKKDILPNVIIGDEDHNKFYVVVKNNKPTYVKRPILDVTVNEGVLVGVPAGAFLWWENNSLLSVGGDIDLNIAEPGKYVVQIDPFPYQVVKLIVKIKGDYLEERRKSYPSIGDQLDTIWKFISKMNNLPVDVKLMLDDIDDVKRRFPKR